ncbi:2OG-Fe(II) oxygenase [Sphingomonas sp. RIT328]|uniref:2OG-Fe(II) oxygenase n=1 Tax=Sphingomonas sp. RIT328 TaxID=1470591 RepID=UPI001F295BCA|nr:2OG-Fe(II) oxygenase [Sphingomonas sp. RIT328]
MTAVAEVQRRAAAGDGEALFQLGLWQLQGRPLPRDLPAARSSLRRAAATGNVEARLIEIALTANGTGAAADWQAARRLLGEAVAAGDAPARQLETLLAAMPLDDAGAPASLPPIQPLSADGSVRRAAAAFTPAECAHIARAADDLLAPAVVVDPRTGRSVPHPIRTSDAAVIGPVREDPVIRALNQRIAALSATQIGQGEALTVLRYRPGQQFRLHSDILPQARNQRVTTVLVYLNDDFTGGETTFPDHKLIIRPRVGDAIIFDNVDAASRGLTTARHAGEPVRSGVKWLATRWIRARPFDVWTGPEAV